MLHLAFARDAFRYEGIDGEIIKSERGEDRARLRPEAPGRRDGLKAVLI